MPTRHDLYGFETATLDEALAVVEAAIGASLEERDSSYYAGTYYRLRLGSGRGVRLYKNLDPNTGAHVRSMYASFSILLEIDDVPEMDAIAERLAGAHPAPVRLSSRVMPDDEDDA